MILSASRRTDLPRFYSEWFINRVRAGYALTRNPMNRAQLSRIQITPQTIDCIVFWTKDAANMLPCLDELDRRGFDYYFQFTLTPYGAAIERNMRPKAEIEDTFIALSKRLGRMRTVWRYDPIILNKTLDIDYHKAQFRRMCGRLAQYTDTVIISFVDMYPKVRTDLIRPVSDGEIMELAQFIGATAKEYGIYAAACSEKYDLTSYGIGQSHCIDRLRIEKITGCALDVRADKNQRAGCGCCESIDIGAYDTCPGGCVYCYANTSIDRARRRCGEHDPASELIVGSVGDDEKAANRRVMSNKTGALQCRFDNKAGE